MIIECERCRARFHLREGMMRGYLGARVRCRKCGGVINVFRPETPPATSFPAAAESHGSGRGDSGAAEPAREARGRKPVPTRTAAPGGPSRAGETRDAAVRQFQPKGPSLRAAGARPQPGTVYSLDLWRVTHQKKSEIGGFDISGNICPEPILPLPEPALAFSPPETPAAPEEPGGRAEASLFENRISWQEEGVASSPATEPETSPRKRKSSSKRSSRRFLFAERRRGPAFPRPIHIALVYLALLLAGGIGYLLLRFLASLLSEGG